MWSRTVWIENKREVESVIPSSWIVDDKVLWPAAFNAARYLAECREPGSNWRKFLLVKVKLSSGKNEMLKIDLKICMLDVLKRICFEKQTMLCHDFRAHPLIPYMCADYAMKRFMLMSFEI